MPLVAAKCTQCGANIEVDNSKEAGICQYCGTAFITEKAITNYNTYIMNNYDGATINVLNGNVENYLELGKAAYEAENGEEILKYANLALEIKPDSPDAWILKMKSMEYFSTVEDTKLNETYSYGMKAIKYAETEEVKKEVYSYFLSRSLNLMLIALSKMKDTDATKKAFKSAGVSLAAISLVQQTDSKAIGVFHNIANTAINFKLKVPDDIIKNDEKMQEQISVIAKLYLEFCNSDTERRKIYGLSPSEEAQANRRTNLNLIKRGLSEDKNSEIKEDDMVKGKDACYIATCVYGSYDCPQVWTLRRFRDNTLDETWYGRLFIKCYYIISPGLVKRFGKTKWFRSFWKSKLDKMVDNLNNKGVDNTFYNDKY